MIFDFTDVTYTDNQQFNFIAELLCNANFELTLTGDALCKSNDIAEFNFINTAYSNNQEFNFSNNALICNASNDLVLTGNALCQPTLICNANADLILTATSTVLIGIHCTSIGELILDGLAVCSIANAVLFDFTDAVYSNNSVFDFGTPALTCNVNVELILTGGPSCEFKTHLIADAHAELILNSFADCNSIVNLCTAYTELRLSSSALCEYDFAVKRPLTLMCNAITQDSIQIYEKLCSNQQQGELQRVDTITDTQNALPLIAWINSNIENSILISNNYCDKKQSALGLYNQLISKTDLVKLLFSELTDNKQEADYLANNWLSVQDVLILLLSELITKTNDTGIDIYSILYDSYLSFGYENNTEFNFINSYSNNTIFIFNNDELIILCERIARGVLTTSINSPLERGLTVLKKLCSLLQRAKLPDYGKSPHIDRPRPPPVLPPLPPNQTPNYYTIPIKAMYAINHEISVLLLPDNTELAIDRLSLSYDWDSYAWLFSGTLKDKTQATLIQLGIAEPVKLSITINGYNWIIVIDELPETREFGKTDIKITGKSLSCLLHDPYQVPSSYTVGSDMTIQQIADSLMPYQWSINWLTDTWLIPASTYSHSQKTILQAIKDIAANIGAVVVPSRNAQTLNVQKQYPIQPWYYYETGIEPNLVIPDDAIKSISTKTKIQSQINAVYVHGNQNGVLAWCRFNGTAGDVLTTTQSNPLITDVTAARNLGEKLLADKYTQPSVTSITTFLGGDFPLAEIGQLVEVNNERATINGVSIDVEFGKITQTITVGNQTANAYSRLKRLLPESPLLVGRIETTDNMTSVLTLIGGGVITVRGTGTIGTYYYTRNGIIESEAPQLEPFEIVI